MSMRPPRHTGKSPARLGFHHKWGGAAAANQGGQGPNQKHNGGQTHRRYQPQHQIIERHASIPLVASQRRISHRNLQTATSNQYLSQENRLPPEFAPWVFEGIFTSPKTTLKFASSNVQVKL